MAIDKKRVVITGLGVIGSNGIGKDNFLEAVFHGVSGIKPISLFDTSSFKVKTAGEISDFDAQKILGSKGLRTLDRSTKLIVSAASLALTDAKLSVTEENTDNIGVVIGNTLGSVSSISDFDREALTDGPQYVNPALFPNTVINSPASQVSIKFGIKGFNTTISTGFSAGLDVFKYALDFLRLERAKIVLVGAVEELCIQTFLGFYKLGFLSGLKDHSPEISCPFDKRRNGIVLGEAAAILVLEDLDSALARQADIYAEVIGYGTAFDAYRVNQYNPKGTGLKKAMRMALETADITARDVNYISAAANSTIEADKLEAEAVKGLFGNSERMPKVSSLKSILGECFSATGVMQAIAATGAVRKQAVPPTMHCQEPDHECGLNLVTDRACNCDVENVLVNSFGPSGCNSSLVISKFK